MTAEKPTKAIVWKTIYTRLIDSGITPLEVRLHPGDISAVIQLQDGECDDVAAALYEFGLPKGEVWAMRGQGPHLWFEGEAEEFYAWGRYSNHSVASPLLPGWNVSIYCQVRTADYPLQADAAVLVAEAVAVLDEPKARDRADLFAAINANPCPSCGAGAGVACVGRPFSHSHIKRRSLPPVEVLSGEVTSPYGPCSGLTPDLRDNTCTRFAAEYVSYPSPTAGLTTGDEFTPATEYRRLCTPCADAAPGRISRRPLTTSPGGYPVERAS